MEPRQRLESASVTGAPMIVGAMQDFSLTLDKFLVHAAKWHPATEVVSRGADGVTARIGYAALSVRAKQVSEVLATHGVVLGDCVATLAWNTQAHLEAWYGIIGMGAVCHTLNPRLRATQLASMISQSQTRVLIVSEDLIPLAHAMLEHAPRVAHVLAIDAAQCTSPAHHSNPRTTALETLIQQARRDFIWGEFGEFTPSGLCYTSGTTGSPKGVTYTHRSTFLHTLRLLQADVFGMTSSDTVMPVVPMFHANAWGLPFAAPAAGAKMVLPGRHTDGASLSRLIAAEAVTIAVGVPTVWLGLVEHVETHGGELPSLKRIVVGGAPMPPALMERLERRLGVIVQTSWGMTELSPSGTVSPPDAGRKASLSGRPAVGVDLMLTDAEGRALQTQRNVEGHLRVRGPAVIARYFGHEEPATDANGWFDTGDLARIDSQGNLIITGRAKDLIKSGGEWINPNEIEAIIGAVPEVALAAVIGRADPKWGERPVLIVEMREGETISDALLLEPLRARVLPWWLPDAIIRVRKMPLAPTGKIDKTRLRSQYGQP